MRACAQVRLLNLDGDVHFILCADAVELAPALATSQRAVRRPVVGYTLLDPIGPLPVDPLWPQAPITVVHHGPLDRTWALRGWRTMRVTEPGAVLAAIDRAVDDSVMDDRLMDGRLMDGRLMDSASTEAPGGAAHSSRPSNHRAGEDTQGS